MSPPLRAVLFDYGHTLLEVDWDEDQRVAGERRLLAVLGDPVSPRRLRAALEPELVSAEATGEHAEVDYPAALDRALDGLGVRPRPAELAAAIRAEVMDGRPRRLHPRALELLDRLRALGLRLGVVSNTPDPPELVAELVAADGVGERLDALVLSSQVGVRKPAARIYLVALERLGTAAAETLFVGDRVREDVAGPAAVGMPTCLATWFRSDPGDQFLADHVAAVPLQVEAIVRPLVDPAGRGKLRK